MTGFLVGLLMNSHGLSPALLAARANIRPSSLDAILAETKEPTTREKTSLARALNVPVESLSMRPAPGLETRPNWRKLTEALYQEGIRYGWNEVDEFLVVVMNTWGRHKAHQSIGARRASPFGKAATR